MRRTLDDEEKPTTKKKCTNECASLEDADSKPNNAGALFGLSAMPEFFGIKKRSEFQRGGEHSHTPRIQILKQFFFKGHRRWSWVERWGALRISSQKKDPFLR